MDQRVFAHMIGVPFTEKGRGLTGFDCWGVVRFGLWNAFQIEVPSYAEDYATTKEGEEIAALIGRESLGWLDVAHAAARPGDVLILRMKGRPWHCGLIVDPPYFIHAVEGIGTIRDRWDSLAWASRVVSIHRHPQLQEVACSV
jgi:Cell wall-associated hydrolases (invasion-associated proteins)